MTPALSSLLPSKLLVDPEVAQAVDALPNKVNELGYDAWGFHPESAKLLYTLGKRLLMPYFRPEVVGIENIPPKGRMMIVPNHSGQLPIDGAVIAISTLLYGHRLVRAMVERWFPTLPHVNKLISRAGAALGAPINCRNLLEDDQAILVFPEGARGVGKTIWRRYELEEFGRGFMRLALQTNTPVIPCAVVGAEESIVSVANVKPLAKALGTPFFPVAPLFPVLGPLAYLPMPVRFHVRFGKPLVFEGRHDDEDQVIDQKVKVVTEAVQQLISEGRAARGGRLFR